MKKIMVVDDERDFLALVNGYLKRAGYEVAVSPSCNEGLNMLKSFGPDLIYMDINVGTEDGRVMCKRIKSMAEHNHVIIVLISANDDAVNTYKEYQADSFLKKPFQACELLNSTAFHLAG